MLFAPSTVTQHCTGPDLHSGGETVGVGFAARLALHAEAEAEGHERDADGRDLRKVGEGLSEPAETTERRAQRKSTR